MEDRVEYDKQLFKDYKEDSDYFVIGSIYHFDS